MDPPGPASQRANSYKIPGLCLAHELSNLASSYLFQQMQGCRLAVYPCERRDRAAVWAVGVQSRKVRLFDEACRRQKVDHAGDADRHQLKRPPFANRTNWSPLPDIHR